MSLEVFWVFVNSRHGPPALAPILLTALFVSLVRSQIFDNLSDLRFSTTLSDPWRTSFFVHAILQHRLLVTRNEGTGAGSSGLWMTWPERKKDWGSVLRPTGGPIWPLIASCPLSNCQTTRSPLPSHQCGQQPSSLVLILYQSRAEFPNLLLFVFVDVFYLLPPKLQRRGLVF